MKPKPPLHIWSLFRFKSLGGLRTQGCSWDFQTSGALPSLTKKGWMWITWSSVSNQVVPICAIRALILCCLEIPRVSLGGQLSAARHLPLLSSVQADGAIWVASCQVNEYFTKLMVNAKTKHLNIFILAVLQNRASSHQMWSWHEEHQVDWRLLQKAYFIRLENRYT